MNTTLQMRSKGTLVIPAELRQKYALSEGDVFTLIDLGDGAFFLVPRVSLVPKLVAEMEAIRIEAGLTVEDLLEGLSEQRQQLYQERIQKHV
ncbi:MAG: AbrB/MazE/SpoVT family DNA-binding domain-containing protein [Chloroflexi bacterium]|nr:AbrB/MazE/SpoVT family DNA-binding domain-containing protein [Chloroflexota bacterium]